VGETATARPSSPAKKRGLAVLPEIMIPWTDSVREFADRKAAAADALNEALASALGKSDPAAFG